MNPQSDLSREAAGSAQAKAERSQHRQSRCVMLLPEDLAGKRVLDIGCRKGLGAFKIADRVGPEGFVVGTDSVPEHLAVAVARASQQHWEGEDWGRYLRFVQANGCALEAAGLAEASFDVVVVNSVLNLEPDLAAALAEISRVLVPGGLLYHDAVLSRTDLPAATAEACRTARNVFGCAPTLAQFEAALAAAGFSTWAFEGTQPLEPPEGDVREDLAAYGFASAIVRAYR